MSTKAADVQALRAELVRLRRLPKRDDRKGTRDVCLVLLDLWTEHGLRFPTERHREAWVRFARESDSRYLDEDPLLERWPFPVPPGYQAPLFEELDKSCNRLPPLVGTKYSYHEDSFGTPLLMVGLCRESRAWKMDCLADFVTLGVHVGTLLSEPRIMSFGDGFISVRTVQYQLDLPHMRLGTEAYNNALSRLAAWRTEYEALLYGLVQCPLPPQEPGNPLLPLHQHAPTNDRILKHNAAIAKMYFPPERDPRTGIPISGTGGPLLEDVTLPGIHGERLPEILSVFTAIDGVGGLVCDDLPRLARTLLQLACWEMTGHADKYPTTPAQVTEFADLVRPVVRKIEWAYRTLIRDLITLSPIPEETE